MYLICPLHPWDPLGVPITPLPGCAHYTPGTPWVCPLHPWDPLGVPITPLGPPGCVHYTPGTPWVCPLHPWDPLSVPITPLGPPWCAHYTPGTPVVCPLHPWDPLGVPITPLGPLDVPTTPDQHTYCTNKVHGGRGRYMGRERYMGEGQVVHGGGACMFLTPATQFSCVWQTCNDMRQQKMPMVLGSWVLEGS